MSENQTRIEAIRRGRVLIDEEIDDPVEAGELAPPLIKKYGLKLEIPGGKS